MRTGMGQPDQAYDFGVLLQGNGGGNLKETYPATAPLIRQGVTDLP